MVTQRFQAATALLFACLLVTPALAEEPQLEPVPAAIQKELSRLSLKTVHGELGEQIREYYASREHAAAWLNREQELKELVQGLAELARHALHLRVDVAEIRDAVERAKNEKTPEAEAKADVLLTRAFFYAGEALDRGQLPLSNYRWNIPEVPTPLGPALEAGLRGGDVDGALLGLAPPHPGYRELRELRASLQEVRDSGGWPEVGSGKTLELGAVDGRVAAIRDRLRATGDLESKPGSAEEERTFDEGLLAAVKKFQQRHGLEADGLVGGRTLQALQTSVEDRIAQLDVNLERWRWLPRELPERHVRVNIAGYEVEAWKKGELALRSRVVVGATDWKTPVFTDEIESISVNPKWYVPSRIASEEVMPLLNEKPDWAASQGFRAVDRETGESVAPGDVDWGEDAYDRYRIVQDNGTANPLGKAKFVMRNRYAVYLHGTDAPQNFETAMRARSHGCVRVEDVDGLAEFLSGNEEEHEAFLAAAEGKRTKEVALAEPVPVFLVYFTATARDGGLLYAPDVYSFDAPMKRTLEALEEKKSLRDAEAKK